MRACIVGAGAIGGYIAGRLALSGAAQTSVLARGATLEALRSRGLRLASAAPDGAAEKVASVPAADSAADLGPQDVVVLAVKAQAAPAAVESIRPLLGPSTVVLPALNGVPWWFFDGFGGPCRGAHLASVDPGGKMAASVPASRVIGTVVHFSCSSPAPGVVRHYTGDRLILGEPSGIPTQRLAAVAATLGEAGFTIDLSNNIRTDAWYKLWGNLTVNPVAALTGATAGQILADDLVRTFCESAMLEAREIGARIGCPISQSPGDRNAITRKLGNFGPSMLQDAEAGRRLELDALTGAVREIGALVGVPTPAVDALHGLSRLAERVRLNLALGGPARPGTAVSR
ncbi:MAG TPA: 2-dehydropantoate 2-reductase [Trebonia sp.]|nr:2-dehydropantoate 2-reductase [Trebonia sp.]